MDTATPTQSTLPPRLIACLSAGFNLVAGRIYLIFIPVALDLLLWLGPHFRIRQVFQPLIADWISTVQAGGSAEIINMLAAVRQLWDVLLERFNLLSFLSTLPVGVPSLLTGVAPLKNPLGAAPVYEVTSVSQVFSGFLLFSLLGLLLGSLYFGFVARSTTQPPEPFSFPRFIWETGQVLLFVLLLILIVLVLAIPVSLITTILAMISPGLAQLAMLFMGFILLWLFIPLVFSPHGVFAAHQNIFRSMLISARMVRMLFPGVGLFLLSALVLTQGMGYLWRIPPETSWLMLAGILGNAYISTGLLAASFVYYRGAVRWVEDLRRNLQSVKI
ncbi:MAG TPA: hypothetical protein PJ988_04340 [Anaerolinea sp.]|mgnify:FL=1|nr:hypothetical protein [Anaerolinea sp.]